MLHANLAALALAATAATVSGCGGSSKSSTTAASTAAPVVPVTTSAATATPLTLPSVAVRIGPGRPLTQTVWIARGDAVCARLNRELETITVKRARELPRVLPQEAAYERAAVAELAKLVPPAARTHDWQSYLVATLQLAEGSDRLAAEFSSLGDNVLKAPLAVALITARQHLNAIARHDGFKDCSQA